MEKYENEQKMYQSYLILSGIKYRSAGADLEKTMEFLVFFIIFMV